MAGAGAVKGIGAVRAVASEITGRPIDAVLIVDLVGVIRVVDAMGGIDIDVPEAVRTTATRTPAAGPSGSGSRPASSTSTAIRPSPTPEAATWTATTGGWSASRSCSRRSAENLGPESILNAPALFGAAKGTAWTDLPRESLPALVELFGRAADAKVRSTSGSSRHATRRS